MGLRHSVGTHHVRHMDTFTSVAHACIHICCTCVHMCTHVSDVSVYIHIWCATDVNVHLWMYTCVHPQKWHIYASDVYMCIYVSLLWICVTSVDVTSDTVYIHIWCECTQCLTWRLHMCHVCECTRVYIHVCTSTSVAHMYTCVRRVCVHSHRMRVHSHLMWMYTVSDVTHMHTCHVCECTHVYIHVCTCTFVAHVYTCVWRDVFMRVKWIIHMCDVTYSCAWHDSFWCVTWLIHMCDITHSYVWHDPFICATELIHMCDMTHPRVTWLNNMQHDMLSHGTHLESCCRHTYEWVMSHILMRHDMLSHGTHLKMCAMTQTQDVCHDSSICMTWLIHMCDVTHPYVWHDSFICVTWLIHVCDMTHPYMWQDAPALPHLQSLSHTFFPCPSLLILVIFSQHSDFASNGCVCVCVCVCAFQFLKNLESTCTLSPLSLSLCLVSLFLLIVTLGSALLWLNHIYDDTFISVPWRTSWCIQWHLK